MQFQDTEHELAVRDLGPLAWVLDELRKSLDASASALRRYLREAAQAQADQGHDGPADPAPLRIARQHLHQALGALEMVGLSGPAQVLRATETALQAFVERPGLCVEAAVVKIERAGFALLEFLETLLAGKIASPVALFPQYREVLALSGAERVHPADLWPVDWRWQQPELPEGVQRLAYAPAVRTRMDQAVLRIVKSADAAAALELSRVCLGLAAAADEGRQRAFWQVCAGFFEAMASGLLPPDLYVKRAASRVLVQYAQSAKGEAGPSERLAQDLVFFCGQAVPASPADAPLLHAVRTAWGLVDVAPVDYTAERFGRFDPALLAQVRKRIAAAKDIWSQLAGGEGARLRSCAEHFRHLADALGRLHPASAPLAAALQAVGEEVSRSENLPGAELAMEVATAVLYLEAAFQDLDADESRLEARAARLAERLQQAHAGAAPETLEPWMEELYRRVSDRQTMGSVVGELRVALGEIEKDLDSFFRDPQDLASLQAVLPCLAQMRGVLSVLGLDQADRAVLRMREDIENLLRQPAGHLSPGDKGFESLGNSLGTLGFLIDMLNYQPALAKKLFVFDAALGELRPLMGRRAVRHERTAQAPQAAPGLPATEPAPASGEPPSPAPDAPVAGEPYPSLDGLEVLELSEAGLHAAASPDPAEIAADAFAAAPVAPVTPQPAMALPEPAATPSEDDPEAELRQIFIDEAAEVMQTARDALDVLSRHPSELGELTVVRRAFHTLKGSSRMVGLAEFGEAAWSLEQVFNAWLADHKPATEPLLDLAGQAIAGLGEWVAELAQGQPARAWEASLFRDPADAFRTRGESQAIVLPAAAVPEVPPMPDAPTASDGAVEPDSATQASDGPAFEADLAPHPSPESLPDVWVEAVAMFAPGADGDGSSDASELAGITAESLEPDSGLPELAEVAPDDLPEEAPTDAGLAVADASEAFDASAVVLATEATPEAIASEPVQTDPAALEIVTEPASIERAPVASTPSQSLEPMEAAPAAMAVPEPEVEAEAEAQPEPEPQALWPGAACAATRPDALLSGLPPLLDDDQVRVIGSLRIPIPLYNVYLNEADEWSRRLQLELSEWALEHAGELPESCVGMAHSLAGSSATVGFQDLSHVARSLEQSLLRTRARGCGSARHGAVYNLVAEDIRRLLHQFAAGFLKQPDPRMLQALAELDADAPAAVAPAAPGLAEPAPEAVEAPLSRPDEPVDVVDAVDAVDGDLFPIFEEEAAELLPELGGALRQWHARPRNRNARDAVLRVLHTLKGSARLAGALRLGEMAHRLESRVEQAGGDALTEADVEPLLQRFDALQSTYEALCAAQARVEVQPPAAAAVPDDAPAQPAAAAPAATAALAPPVTTSLVAQRAAASQAVRVRTQLLDRLMNQAGEVMISRSRLEDELRHLRASLHDLTANLDRLRSQLRDIELQAEMQMQSRLAQAKDSAVGFDPLEFDRFTRVQELTRMMAESVNDVATVQRNLQRTVEAGEDELAAQARQTRELQRDLLRTRMVEFESIADRLYRVVRQASKDTGRLVKLDIEGGSIEMDRGVLDRMTPAFEHLLRNCVAHGIEDPALRRAAGKDGTGRIRIVLGHERNDVSIEFRDDGAGLDLARIRERAVQQGLLAAEAEPGEAETIQLIFAPGFSTAGRVTELSGRGIGMDVVRSEVNALGGRIEVDSRPGQGAGFRLVLPLTTAVTQVVMVRGGEQSLGVSANLVEIVRRATPAEIEQAYESGRFAHEGEQLPFFWSGALLESSPRSSEPPARSQPVVIFRSASQRVAVHVDEVLGSQEVVVKNLGPQLSRLPGLAGMSVLPSGAVVLIYNPVALAAVYGEQAARFSADRTLPTHAGPGGRWGQPTEAPRPPLVLVVDDSITVRRVTQRLLQREGYRVALAADGLQALERLAEETPAVVLSDIEMPRMDGFDLARNIRADARWAELPIVMITSRIAEKHREHARQLGVRHYLGKPYSEDELLGLVRRYCSAALVG